MRTKRAISVLRAGAIFCFLCLAATIGSPAHAQMLSWLFGREQTPSLTDQLVSRGYRVLALRRAGGVYQADVVEGGGVRRRLIIDAYSGAILQVVSYGTDREAQPTRRKASIEIDRPSSRSTRELAPVPPEDVGPAAAAPSRAKRDLSRKKRAFASREERVETDDEDSSETDSSPSIKAHKTSRHPAAAVKRAARPIEASAPEELPTSALPANRPGVADKAQETAPTPQPSHDVTASVRPVSAAPVSAGVRASEPAPTAPALPTTSQANRPGYANGVPINPLD